VTAAQLGVTNTRRDLYSLSGLVAEPATGFPEDDLHEEPTLEGWTARDGGGPCGQERGCEPCGRRGGRARRERRLATLGLRVRAGEVHQRHRIHRWAHRGVSSSGDGHVEARHDPLRRFAHRTPPQPPHAPTRITPGKRPRTQCFATGSRSTPTSRPLVLRAHRWSRQACGQPRGGPVQQRRRDAARRLASAPRRLLCRRSSDPGRRRPGLCPFGPSAGCRIAQCGQRNAMRAESMNSRVSAAARLLRLVAFGLQGSGLLAQACRSRRGETGDRENPRADCGRSRTGSAKAACPHRGALVQ
jgi:hypothetical protein